MSEKAGSSIAQYDTDLPGIAPGANMGVYQSRPLGTDASELQLLSLELAVGAQLCSRWSKAAARDAKLAEDDPNFAEQNAQCERLSKKRKKLTAMVLAGIGTGKTEDVPREIVREEAELCRGPAQAAWRVAGEYRDAQHLSDALAESFVYSIPGKPGVSVERRFVVTDALQERIEEFLKSESPQRAELAYALAGARFGIGTDSARSLALGKRKKGHRTDFCLASALLASAWTDLLRDIESGTVDLCTAVLSALTDAGYSTYSLYHRIQFAHSCACELPSSVSKAHLEQLCKWVCKLPPAGEG